MAPVLSTVSPTSGPAAGGTAVTLSGSGFAGASSVKFGTVSVPFTLVSSSQITTTSPAGSGSVAVTVTTPSGTSNGVTFTYVGAPVLTSLSPSQGSAGGGTAVTLNGSGFTSVTSVTFGSAAASFTVESDTQIIATSPAGSGSVAVTVTSASGTSNAVTYTYLEAPVITSLSPSQGPTSGGNTVTINGTGVGFVGASAVHFGSHSAAILSNHANEMTVTAPAGPAAPVDVTVTAPGGTSAPVPYYYIAPPTVDALDPAVGPAAGGNVVNVYGGNLTLASAVHFGYTPATSFSVESDSHLTVTAPPGTGTVSVTVLTPGGTSPAKLGGAYYIYVAAPVVDSLSPAQGPASGGNHVTLTGSSLTHTDDVRFGGVRASFAVLSDTQIVAIAPKGVAGSTNVTVHTPAGDSGAVSYQYLP